MPGASVIVDSIAGEKLRQQVARDDIVDALALAVTAKLGYENLMTLPADPPADDAGLPMEIVYANGPS